MWTLSFTETSLKQIAKLNSSDQHRIFDYLETRIVTSNNPKTLAKPLKGKRRKFWRFRVGDYRIIADILDQQVVIQIVQVGHRREIYH